MGGRARLGLAGALAVLTATVPACGRSELLDGGIPLRHDGDSAVLRVVDVTRQGQPIDVELDEETVEGTGDFLVVSFEIDNQESFTERFFHDQVAIGWDDKYVMYQYLDSASTEIAADDTTQVDLTFALNESENVESIASPTDLRVLYNDEMSPGFAETPDGYGSLADAREIAEVDVLLSELWDGSFDS